MIGRRQLSTKAWLLRGIGNLPGRLQYVGGRLAFTAFGTGNLWPRQFRKLERDAGVVGLAQRLNDEDRAVVFDVPVSDIRNVRFPSYYFSGPARLVLGGRSRLPARLHFAGPSLLPQRAFVRTAAFVSPMALVVAMAILLSGCAGLVRGPSAPATGPQVRVGLLVDSAFVELSSPDGLELVDPDSDRRIAELRSGERVEVRADSTGRLVLEMDGSETQTGLRLLSGRPSGDGVVSIGGRPYRGTAVVLSTGPGRLTAINQLDMETYLLGVVPREIGNVGEELLETAKAQAVAARTYAVRYMGRRADLGFDVFATVQDQVYGGVEAEHGPVSRAVRETAGEILTFEGEPIQAFYSSTCAGHTSSIHEVWPIEPPRSYLTSISDINPQTGQAFCRSSNRFEWTERWSIAEFNDVLNRTLADSLPPSVLTVGALRDLRVLDRTPEGRIRALAITTEVDTFIVGGDRIRWVFERPNGLILNSSKFDVALLRDPEGRPSEVVAIGGGWGHGIGMCQVGAMGRARAGQDYRTILRSYYQGTAIRSLY